MRAGPDTVCFEGHYVRFDTMCRDPATDEPLSRYIVYSEDSREVARFVLPAGKEASRWEIREAADAAIKAARRRRSRRTSGHPESEHD
jgi:hypothetical protein